MTARAIHSTPNLVPPRSIDEILERHISATERARLKWSRPVLARSLERILLEERFDEELLMQVCAVVDEQMEGVREPLFKALKESADEGFTPEAPSYPADVEPSEGLWAHQGFEILVEVAWDILAEMDAETFEKAKADLTQPTSPAFGLAHSCLMALAYAAEEDLSVSYERWHEIERQAARWTQAALEASLEELPDMVSEEMCEIYTLYIEDHLAQRRPLVSSKSTPTTLFEVSREAFRVNPSKAFQLSNEGVVAIRSDDKAPLFLRTPGG